MAKGQEFDDLVVSARSRLRAVVLLGVDRGVIAAALARHAPDVPVITVATPETGAMAEVVQHAASLAQPGDTVLLAPGCASWDMFRDYTDRGRQFAEAVAALPGFTRPRRRRPVSETTARTDTEQVQPAPAGRLALLLNHPLSTYYLLLGATLLLLVLGLIMVLSASSIESFRVFGSAYTLVQRQALFAVLGVVAMVFASRTSVQFWRGFAWVLFAIAFGLLVAVLSSASRWPGSATGSRSSGRSGSSRRSSPSSRWWSGVPACSRSGTGSSTPGRGSCSRSSRWPW